MKDKKQLALRRSGRNVLSMGNSRTSGPGRNETGIFQKCKGTKQIKGRQESDHIRSKKPRNVDVHVSIKLNS